MKTKNYHFPGCVLSAFALLICAYPVQGQIQPIQSNAVANTESTNESTEVLACDSYYWPVSDNTYTSSGVYSTIVTSSTGTDSIAILNLTINHSSETMTSASACKSYYWDENGQTYTESGLYSYNYTSVNGCDSIVYLNLNVINSNEITPVYLDAMTLFAENTASETGYTYQWFNCGTKSLVKGADQQLFVPEANGFYAVITGFDGCYDTSGCYVMYSLGLDSENVDQEQVAYPNPTPGKLTVDLGALHQNVTVRVFDVLGQLVSTSEYQNATSLDLFIEGRTGYYIVEVNANNKNLRIKVVKE